MIQGEKRERQQLSFTKKVGFFEAKVVAINPTIEELKENLNIELSENSKITEYLTLKDDVPGIRIDFWLEEVKNKEKYRLSINLKEKDVVTKDGSKKQYINNIGTTTWAPDDNSLPEWFTKRDYREAYAGEELLYRFLKTWLSELDYTKDSTVLQLDWKKIIKGNVKDLKEQVDGAYCGNVLALASVSVSNTNGENKEYQRVYDRVLPVYYQKNFRLINYNDPKVVQPLRDKKPKDLKPHERFVVEITGQYGCKDYYVLRDLQEYNPDDNLVASDKVISDDGDDF